MTDEKLSAENRALVERVVQNPAFEGDAHRLGGHYLNRLLNAARKEGRAKAVQEFGSLRPQAGSAPGGASSGCSEADWSAHEDDIADAISDSIDMDWTSRDGAKAVVRYLNTLGSNT